MNFNKCGGTNYTDFAAVTKSAKGFVYLNSSSKFYWFGAGRYDCKTGKHDGRVRFSPFDSLAAPRYCFTARVDYHIDSLIK